MLYTLSNHENRFIQFNITIRLIGSTITIIFSVSIIKVRLLNLIYQIYIKSMY